MSQSDTSRGENPSAVDVRLFSVPDVGHHCLVRILGQGYGLMTHYVPRKPTLCRGDGKCDSKLHSRRPQWRGYYPALVLYVHPYKRWVHHVLEITERLGEVWWEQDLVGQEWHLERIMDGKYEVLTGHWRQSLDRAHLPEPCLLEPVLQRVYRVERIPPSIDPKLKAREWKEEVLTADTVPAKPLQRKQQQKPGVPDARPEVARLADEATKAAIPFGGDPRLAQLFQPKGVNGQPPAERNEQQK